MLAILVLYYHPQRFLMQYENSTIINSSYMACFVGYQSLYCQEQINLNFLKLTNQSSQTSI